LWIKYNSSYFIKNENQDHGECVFLASIWSA